MVTVKFGMVECTDFLFRVLNNLPTHHIFSAISLLLIEKKKRGGKEGKLFSIYSFALSVILTLTNN